MPCEAHPRRGEGASPRDAGGAGTEGPEVCSRIIGRAPLSHGAGAPPEKEATRAMETSFVHAKKGIRGDAPRARA